MVVWLKPCESRSLPGASSKTLRSSGLRVFCWAKNVLRNRPWRFAPACASLRRRSASRAMRFNASRKRESSPHPELGSECAARSGARRRSRPEGRAPWIVRANAPAPMVVWLKPCESRSLPGPSKKKAVPARGRPFTLRSSCSDLFEHGSHVRVGRRAAISRCVEAHRLRR